MKNLFRNVWSGERCFDVAATVTSNEMTVLAHVGMGSKEESSIAASSKVAEQAALCLLVGCLTRSAMPYLMAVLGS